MKKRTISLFLVVVLLFLIPVFNFSVTTKAAENEPSGRMWLDIGDNFVKVNYVVDDLGYLSDCAIFGVAVNTKIHNTDWLFPLDTGGGFYDFWDPFLTVGEEYYRIVPPAILSQGLNSAYSTTYDIALTIFAYDINANRLGCYTFANETFSTTHVDVLLSEYTIEVGKDGGSFDVDFMLSSQSVPCLLYYLPTEESPPSWVLSLKEFTKAGDPYYGTSRGDGRISFIVDENNTGEARIGKIHVYVGENDGSQATIVINQSADFLPLPPNSYTISFDLNGGTGYFPDKKTNSNGEFTFPMEKPTYDDDTFLGWSEDMYSPQADYLPGDFHVVEKDTTFYAVWEERFINDGDIPIIFIPGIAGSELFDGSGNKLWFALYAVSKLELNNKGESINSIKPTSKGYGANDTYNEMLIELKKEFPGRVHFWGYDWRLDNQDSVKKLDEYINEELNAPEVIIVAHSMGGLIASSYIKLSNGDENKAKVKKIITIATPYLGAPKAAYVFLTGRLLDGGNGIVSTAVTLGMFAYDLGRASTYMPSVYQLLPHNDFHSYLTRATMNTFRFPNRELIQSDESFDFLKNEVNFIGFNGNISAEEKAFFFEKAETFFDSLYIDKVPAIKTIDHTVIIGEIMSNSRSTISNIIIPTKVNNINTSDNFPIDLEKGKGDGTVPVWSATINGALRPYKSFPYDHTNIVKQPDCINYVVGAIRGEVLSGMPLLYASDSITIRIACPVDVNITCGDETLTNKNGGSLATSFGTIDLLGSQNDIKLVTLDGGKKHYSIILQGTDTGTMDYSYKQYDTDNRLVDERTFEGVDITPKTIITADTDNSNKMILHVDENGDGVEDYYWISSEANVDGYKVNGLVKTSPTQEPEDDQQVSSINLSSSIMALYPFIISLVAILVGAVLLALLIIIRRKRRRNSY